MNKKLFRTIALFFFLPCGLSFNGASLSYANDFDRDLKVLKQYHGQKENLKTLKSSVKNHPPGSPEHEKIENDISLTQEAMKGSEKYIKLRKLNKKSAVFMGQSTGKTPSAIEPPTTHKDVRRPPNLKITPRPSLEPFAKGGSTPLTSNPMLKSYMAPESPSGSSIPPEK